MSNNICFAAAAERGYDVNELIGEGTFAQVFSAVHKKSGSRVALKVMRKTELSRRGMLPRVRGEIETHAFCSRHAAVVRMYDSFEDLNSIYIVLELCEGVSGPLDLYELLKYSPKKSLEESQARTAMDSLLSAVLYLHERGVLHRDIKASNLLLSSRNINKNNGENRKEIGTGAALKLADFGLAVRLQRPDEQRFTICGTPNYLAPEVLSGSAQGTARDMWSVGCVLYTMLIGTPPFEAQRPQETMERIRHMDFELPGTLSLEARDILARLLTPFPNKRITAKEALQHPFMNKNRLRKPLQQEKVKILEKKRDVCPSRQFPLPEVIDVTTSLLQSEVEVEAELESLFGSDVCDTSSRSIMTIHSTTSQVKRSRYPGDGEKRQTTSTMLKDIGIEPNHINMDNEVYLKPCNTKRIKAVFNAERVLSKDVKANLADTNKNSNIQTKSVHILKSGCILCEINAMNMDNILWLQSPTRLVLRISRNGQMCHLGLIYSPNSFKIKRVISRYSLSKLPIELCGIYQYASIIVKALRSKTSKVVLSSSCWKASLMESRDFVLAFTQDEMPITRTGRRIQRVLLDANGSTATLWFKSNDSCNVSRHVDSITLCLSDTIFLTEGNSDENEVITAILLQAQQIQKKCLLEESLSIKDMNSKFPITKTVRDIFSDEQIYSQKTTQLKPPLVVGPSMRDISNSTPFSSMRSNPNNDTSFCTYASRASSVWTSATSSWNTSVTSIMMSSNVGVPVTKYSRTSDSNDSPGCITSSASSSMLTTSSSAVSGGTSMLTTSSSAVSGGNLSVNMSSDASFSKYLIAGNIENDQWIDNETSWFVSPECIEESEAQVQEINEDRNVLQNTSSRSCCNIKKNTQNLMGLQREMNTPCVTTDMLSAASDALDLLKVPLETSIEETTNEQTCQQNLNNTQPNETDLENISVCQANRSSEGDLHVSFSDGASIVLSQEANYVSYSTSLEKTEKSKIFYLNGISSSNDLPKHILVRLALAAQMENIW